MFFCYSEKCQSIDTKLWIVYAGFLVVVQYVRAEDFSLDCVMALIIEFVVM